MCESSFAWLHIVSARQREKIGVTLFNRRPKFTTGLLHSGADPDNEMWKHAFEPEKKAVQHSVQPEGSTFDGSKG
jgi:hypothetical protein